VKEQNDQSSIFSKVAAFFKPHIRDVTEDDVHTVLLEGEKSGALQSEERNMVEGVFYLGDRPVGAFMTHRSEVEWLDVDMGPEEALGLLQKTLASSDSPARRFFPIARSTLDEIEGVVGAEDILFSLLETAQTASRTADGRDAPPEWKGLGAIAKKARFIPETMTALKAFEAFKRENTDFLCVMDEYGGFAGTLTLRDLIEAIVGELSVSSEEAPILKQEDGSYLADGSVNIDTLAEAIGLEVSDGEHKDYHTLAGYILSMAEEIPRTGALFTRANWTFRIVDMDGNRIDKVLLRKH
jgi:putative hemolysin